MSGKKKGNRIKKRLRARSAVTGRFVTLAYAKRFPWICVIEKY